MADEEPDAPVSAEDLESRNEETTLRDDLAIYMDAFQRLRYDRQYGAMGGESPISFMAIDRYADRFNFIGDEFLILHALIQALDDEYLAWLAEKQAEEEEERKAKNG